VPPLVRTPSTSNSALLSALLRAPRSPAFQLRAVCAADMMVHERSASPVAPLLVLLVEQSLLLRRLSTHCLSSWPPWLRSLEGDPISTGIRSNM
jgi:hypothetical protein